MGGLIVEFTFPRTAQRLSLGTEINFTHLKYDRTERLKYSSFDILTENMGSHSEISMPLIVKYLLWKGKFNAYFHLGLNSLIILYDAYKTSSTEIFSPELQLVKKDKNPLLGEQYGIGFLAGINLQRRIGKTSIGLFARAGINNLLTSKKVDINSEEFRSQLGLTFTL